MRFANPYLRAGLAFAVVVIFGGWLWFDWDAKMEGFAGHLDRRAARDAGILASSEWRAMRAAGDIGPAASGGAACTTDACRTAEALLGGRWAGGAGDCASGNLYRFTDAAAEVATLKDGQVTETISRRYRVVGARVELRPRGADGKPLERNVAKQPGDIEVFTLGRSAYVRRIFRAVDADNVRLVLVEQRAGRAGPAAAVIVDGAPAAGGAAVAYRRCPAA
ncbi:MAG: hypothetical protein ACRCTI_07340 [Beijerinckiaceae bacterium]